jgi:hypothetical protein
MGEGGVLRVLFGGQPKASPMRRNRNGCGLLGLLAIAATAAVVAGAMTLVATVTGSWT